MRKLRILAAGLVLGASPLLAQATWTPAQEQVLRHFQAAELARQNCRTYVRIAPPAPDRRSEGLYHIERSPEKTAEAGRDFGELLAQAEAAFGPRDPQVARVLASFARLLEDQGSRLDLAESCYRRCLEIRREALGSGNPETLDALSDLGVFYHGIGSYGAAEACLGECLAASKPGPRAARVQRALGLLYEDLGDYDHAQDLFSRALAAQRDALGPGHLEAARTLCLLAALSVRQGDVARCGSLAAEALAAISRPGSGATSGDRFTAHVLALLPEICQGHIHAAVAQMYKFYFTLLEKNDWAWFLGELNDYAYPALIAQRSYATRGLLTVLDTAELQTRQTFGDRHPQVASAIANEGMLLLALKQWDQALPVCIKANELNFEILPSVFAMASERQKLKFVERTVTCRDLLLSAVVAGRAQGLAVAEALKWALRMKGIVLDSMVGEREVLRKGLDPALAEIHRQLRQARQELTGLYIKGPGGDLDGFNARMADLARRCDALESRLSQGSAAFKEARELFAAAPEAVRARMPRGSSLVEFMAFTNHAQPGAPPWMMAFVLDADGAAPPRAVDLGPSAPVEQAILAWRRDLQAFAAGRGDEGEARRRLDGLGRKVAALVWDPVAAKGGGTLYLAPDGPVHLLPFGPLPAGKGYLLEQCDLALVSSGKDFLRRQGAGARTGALLVGGVDFDSSLPAQAPGPASRARGAFGLFKDLAWDPLPGTTTEVEALAEAMGGAHLPVTLLEGGGADKARVIAGFETARYVHLATHGFFLGARDGPGLPGRGIALVGQQPAEIPAAPAIRPVNPLLLSGLALAGANHPAARDPEGWAGEGYLLAMDVANLDLEGVDLVTLSACETGLGEIRRGEGVFGLQRSFLLAGARSLVMSLWSVPDQETKDLMVDFYRRLLAGGSRREGFRQGQLRMLRSGPGGAARHPFFWAAFEYLGVE